MHLDLRLRACRFLALAALSLAAGCLQPARGVAHVDDLTVVDVERTAERETARDREANVREWRALLARDPDRAHALLADAAERGDERAQLLLYGPWDASDRADEGSVAWLERGAQRGDAASQYELGRRHLMGDGVTQDDALAVRWLRSAAELGLARAQFVCGWLAHTGRAVDRDDARAAEWFERAAEQGYAPAEMQLALLHLHGDGVARDDAEALRWMTRAAERGFALAQHDLALMYLRGRGAERDESAAAHWFALAAEHGVEGSRAHLDRLRERDSERAFASVAR